MARKTQGRSGEKRYESTTTAPNESTTAAPEQSGTTQFIDALKEVTESLASANEQLQQFAQSFATAQGGSPASGGPTQINTWDDPFSEAIATVNPHIKTPTAATTAVNGFSKLRTAIVEPQLPPARYNPGTAGFRYWVATEALTRGINF